MNYHELKYILCIAKYQNLTKAAQELYISQPTLTKHLQKLEREMGIQAVRRSGNSYTPTFAGPQIYGVYPKDPADTTGLGKRAERSYRK